MDIKPNLYKSSTGPRLKKELETIYLGVSMGTVPVGWKYFHYHTHFKLLLPILYLYPLKLDLAIPYPYPLK
jgi:hypothetical protein